MMENCAHRPEAPVTSSCPGGRPGPSSALSYAVGFVAQKRQSQAKNRGFRKLHLLIDRTLPPHVARLQGASRLVATCPCLRGAT
jgi:hypothetical protein